MNLAGSGLMLAVVAALWILVFVPAWFQRSQQSAENRNAWNARANSGAPKLKSQKRELRAKELVVEEVRSASPRVRISGRAKTIAARIYRLRALRHIVVSALVISMLSTVGSVAWLATDLNVWVAVVASSFLVVASAVATRKVSDRLAEAIESTRGLRGLAVSRLQYSTRISQQDASDVEQLDPRAWTPVKLPEPKSGLGQIAQVSMASVSPISAADSDTTELVIDGASIDEILERRRKAI
jgi:hypothetical protein